MPTPVVKELRGNNRIGRNLGALIYAPESMLGIMLHGCLPGGSNRAGQRLMSGSQKRSLPSDDVRLNSFDSGNGSKGEACA